MVALVVAVIIVAAIVVGLLWVTVFACRPRAGPGGNWINLVADDCSLSGWDGREGEWRATADGQIIGTTDGDIIYNTFLISQRMVRNFVLRLEVRLSDQVGDSGVVFRGYPVDRDDGSSHVLYGYQLDFQERLTSTGQIYGEGLGTGSLAPTSNATRALMPSLLASGGWNQLTITADGPSLVVAINGVVTAAYTDNRTTALTDGVIGLQLHVNHRMEVAYRDIWLLELP